MTEIQRRELQAGWAGARFQPDAVSTEGARASDRSEMLERMSDGARRAWIQISFGGARGAEYGSRREYGRDLGLRTVLGRLEARAFLLVVQVGRRSLTSLGQLEVGGVAWTRSSPGRSDVARWFYEARVDAPGRVVLTLDHAYAGVFDRRVSGFVGATRPFDPATTIQLDEGADVLHPRDLGGSYVLGARAFARAP